MRDMARLGAMMLAMDTMTTEEKLREIRERVRQPRQPSGKDRSKAKAARKQNRKRKP